MLEHFDDPNRTDKLSHHKPNSNSIGDNLYK